MTWAYIGLGSNLEGPRDQLAAAVAELHQIPQTQVTGLSQFYQSKAVGPEQPDYINAVAHIETQLEPLALLDALQAIEQAHHRVRKEHWGPRTLDLDLLLFEHQLINHPRLTVPHPFLTQRNFVLLPLADIDAGLQLPNGESIQHYLTITGRDGLVAIEQPILAELITPRVTKEPV